MAEQLLKGWHIGLTHQISREGVTKHMRSDITRGEAVSCLFDDLLDVLIADSFGPLRGVKSD